MRHPHTRHAAQGGGAAPLGDAAALRGVHVDEIDGTRVDQATHAVARDLRLAGGDRDARRLPHARHHRRIVVPVARLLEPPDVERLDQVRESHGVVGRPAAVGVDRQYEIGTGRRARRLDAPGVILGLEPADLELAPGHTGPAVGFHLAPDVGERLAFHVVAADGDDRQAPAIAAEQGAHALAQRLADEVPERAVHAGDRLEQHLPVAARVTEREHRLPDALALEDAHAPDERTQRVSDEPYDLTAMLAVVAVVDLADEPAVGPHAGDDGAAREDGVRAPAEVLLQWDLDRDGFDAVDAHAGVLPGAASSRQSLDDLDGHDAVGAELHGSLLSHAGEIGRAHV